MEKSGYECADECGTIFMCDRLSEGYNVDVVHGKEHVEYGYW